MSSEAEVVTLQDSDDLNPAAFLQPDVDVYGHIHQAVKRREKIMKLIGIIRD